MPTRRHGSLVRAASSALPVSVKQRIKHLLHASQTALFRFTPDDLRRELERLGIKPGDVLMVHSAFDRFAGFQGGPVEFIRALQNVVGPEGTLLMPTIPFSRTAIEYALGNPVFDPRRTMSRMGLITEVFRRSPDVVRSLHPTHSVAAWGRAARAMTAGHERADTPCGRQTPYGKLLEYDGRILLAGVSPHTITFGYFVAEEIEPRLAFPVLTRERYALRWTAQDGTVQTSHLRLFSPRLDHDLRPLVRELKRRRQWHQRHVGLLRLVMIRSRDVWEAGMALADRGEFPRERSAR